MDRPVLLDLFCGIGGSAVGYHQAGFDVVGVDVNHQPDYPFTFIQDDAMFFLRDLLRNSIPYDAIHTSPPCQAYSYTQNMPNSNPNHPEMVDDVRDLLQRSGLPYVIENVPGAPLLESSTRLCGSSFGLGVMYSGPSAPEGWYQLQRHRLFETNWELPQLSCVGKHTKPVIGIYGHHPAYARRKYGIGRGQFSRTEKESLAREALGIDWSESWNGLKEAIPPAYTKYVGRYLMGILEDR